MSASDESALARDEARAILAQIGAPPRLVRHAELVGEAAEELLAVVKPLAVIDAHAVRLGARLHDAGKTLHPAEFDAPGKEHEERGGPLLLEQGVHPRIARMCLTHARWRTTPDVTVEDLLVALADSLWKGKRDDELEERVIDALASLAGRDRWEIFSALGDVFEGIAERGPERLERSRV